jgi:DNA-binding protein H-NS
MPSYKELLAQRENLERQITEARQRETSDAIAKVRAIVDEFNLSVAEVFPSRKGRGATKTGGAKASGAKVAPKYKNPATGQTWTGRGKTPKWLDGKDKAKFLIA